MVDYIKGVVCSLGWSCEAEAAGNGPTWLTSKLDKEKKIDLIISTV